MSHFLALALATFASEDLTCIGVGLLVREGEIDLFRGSLACFVGIFVSDLGLWLVGRYLLGYVARWPWLARRLPLNRMGVLGAWLDRHGWVAVFASRFLPGTRLPLYLAAGVRGRQFGRFALWTFLAGLLWTPTLILTVALVGPALVEPLRAVLGHSWVTLPVAAALLLIGFRLAPALATRVRNPRTRVALARVVRWEFWPSWVFYIPLIPWFLLLALRYRSLTVWTAANPGMPDGGVVGESKFDILEQLPAEWVLPAFLVPPGKVTDRLALVRQRLAREAWEFPLIFKPDAGQRGQGVERVDDLIDAEKYLQRHPAATLVQEYHPGPFEAGVFYYRIPGEETGHIFSVTDKVFPEAVGDGRATLEQLIWRHPRYRMQADLFLKRHEADKDRVLAPGERLRLTSTGNHSQGTLFRDGRHLVTPELARTVDAIARQFPGFYFGRFDVRYRSVEDFRAGRDLAVVELNGVTSESTNLYDPARSLLSAYGILYRQWALLFRIGAANRRRGHAPSSVGRLLRLVMVGS